MKKTIFLFATLLIFIGCAKEEVETPMLQEDVIQFMGNGNKVDLCHYSDDDDTWHVISVNENAVQAHLNHGDVILVDADGDGWVEAENECVPGGDCNDNDPAINPGAEEVCGDGIDNNCNDEVDEDCCPCFTLNDLLEENNTSYFDTNGPSFCAFDGVGFESPSCSLYGVAYERFFCVGPGPDCALTSAISLEEKLSCQQLVFQAQAALNLPEFCTGVSLSSKQNRATDGDDDNPFLPGNSE